MQNTSQAEDGAETVVLFMYVLCLGDNKALKPEPNISSDEILQMSRIASPITLAKQRSNIG